MTDNIRRIDRVLSEEMALAIIDRCDYGVVSCFDDNGKIFSIPLSLVREDSCLYIHGAKAGSKTQLYQNGREVQIVCVADNRPPQLEQEAFFAIQNDAKALAQQVFTTKYESAICTANAYQVLDEQQKKHALRLLCEKYCAKYMTAFNTAADMYLDKMNIYRFDMKEIIAKSNKSFQAA